MSLTKAGLMCDVCGMYCVTEMLLGTGVEQFTIKGISNLMHCDDKCKEALIACGSDWTKLPDGPLKKVFEEDANKSLAGNPNKQSSEKEEGK